MTIQVEKTTVEIPMLPCEATTFPNITTGCRNLTGSYIYLQVFDILNVFKLQVVKMITYIHLWDLKPY